MSVQNLEALGPHVRTESSMKRILALAVLVVALWVFVKLAFKPVGPGESASTGSARSADVPADAAATGAESDAKTELVTRSTRPSSRRFARWSRGSPSSSDGMPRRSNGPTACAGSSCSTGWTWRRSSFTKSIPPNFAGCATFLGSDAAADILLHWREYFGLKRADDTDRGILIAEIASLTPAQKRIAAQSSQCPPVDPGRSRGSHRA